MWSRASGWAGLIPRLFLFFLLLLAVFGGTIAHPYTALGQEEEALLDEEEEEGGERPAATDESDPEEAAPASDESMLSWTFEALGWRYSIAFLSLSFTLVALFVMNVLQARRENVVPMHLIEGFEQHLAEKQYQEAYELAKNDDSMLGQVLAAGLAKLKDGYSQAVEGMQEVAEEENMKLDHRMSYMALIGTISPMVGLLGTVDGMIASFYVIASSNSAPKPSELAKGISTALVTTLIGLFLAIPAVAAYHILRNRVARLVLEVGIISEGLMNRFQNVGAKKS